MVTNLTPTTLSTPPPGGGSGFTMDESAIDSLQQQADDLRTGYQEVASTLSGQALAGNAFGTVGAFAVEAFNASLGKSVELAGKAASTLGLVGEGLKATAQTHLEADRANGEQFTSLESAEITDGPRGAPSGGPAGNPTPQGPPVTPTDQLPGATGGGNPSQPAGPPPETPGTTTGQSSTPPPTTQPAPVPDFPEVPDPQAATPNGSTTTANTTPPPTPPIPEAPKDLFKQPGIPDPSTSGGAGGMPSGTGSGTPGGSATTPPTGTTPPPMPPIPEVPKDLFKQPGTPEPGAGLPSTGGEADTPARPASPGLEDGDRRPGESDDREPTAGERPGRDHDPVHEVRHERDEHGFPITSVDGKPCLDLRDLPAEEGERWQENIRDILATKGEGSFFWAGDTIDAEGQRHSLMDLAEFMTNLDSRPETAEQPPRELSDTVTASPARSANGDVYVLLGPNRADDDPVDLADFPTLQGNPRIERVFAIDAVTGRETQIHPKVT
ncbi:hypothetical protein ACFYOT_17520 [Saccharothrix saharensis]|uniref:hypothetical protein n=1 Tax=Saccharothrix saharensis TaxID=571190 RepID=UPI003696FA32